VRVVTATNRVLLDQIAAGAFREDLYYRINVIHLVIPPLRERREDIEPLLHHFLNGFSAKYFVDLPEIAPEVLDRLRAYDWPGNVRELKNVVERLIVRSRGGRVEMHDLPAAIPGPADRRPRPCRYRWRSRIAVRRSRPDARSTHPSTQLLFERIVSHRESFWSAVYAPFMARDLTRDDVRAIVTAGLQHTRGNYKMLLDLFNMEPADYKRFLNFCGSITAICRFRSSG
jgi:DNA-binding NtrC family response regulator